MCYCTSTRTEHVIGYKIYTQNQSVLVEVFVWWEALHVMKVEWSFVEMECGGQCVEMAGTLEIIKLCVGN